MSDDARNAELDRVFVVIDDVECRALLEGFVAERPDVWSEDIGED